MSALEERRQRAREAGWDATLGWSQKSTQQAIESAIETATRVQITDEAVFRAFTELHRGATARAIIHVALEELGFEVEQ